MSSRPSSPTNSAAKPIWVPAKNPAIYAGMDAGKGGIDVHPDVWLPNQKSFTDEFVDKKKTVALSEGYYEGRTGFCIPTATAKEHGIRSVYDLATPEAQKVFDGDGDGEGEIWVGASGWASAKINQVKVRDYGIGDFLTPTTEDEAVFYAKMAAAVKDGEGVAFYCYSPHYVHKLHDVTMIEEPQHDKSKYVMVQPNEGPGLVHEIQNHHRRPSQNRARRLFPFTGNPRARNRPLLAQHQLGRGRRERDDARPVGGKARSGNGRRRVGEKQLRHRGFLAGALTATA